MMGELLLCARGRALSLLEGAYSLTRPNQKARNRLFAREAREMQLATAI
jgi:hypothetical protein